MMKPRYRYPGLNKFTENDADVFCGRDEDVKLLLSQLMLSKTVVLHGESGRGKSSLVQAGLLPALKKYDKDFERDLHLSYESVIIKMDEIKSDKSSDDASAPEKLVAYTISKITEVIDSDSLALPFIKKRSDNIWYTAKILEKKGKSLLLIFDQFEELQGFSNPQIQQFAEKLSELFVSIMPEYLYKEYSLNTRDFNIANMTEDERKAYSENIRFIEKSLNTKILFVIREDKLGVMSLLRNHFPDILKSNFYLTALSRANAYKAIMEPPCKDGQFISEKFEIDDAVVESLLSNLDIAKTNSYDPIELQIVCSNIERKIASKKKVIETKDVKSISNIINEFYQEKWNLIQKELKLSADSLENSKKIIISKLVVGDSRNMVHVLTLNKDGNKIISSVIDLLVRELLLRKIIAEKNNIYYQLSHDRLIEPIKNDLADLNFNDKLQIRVDKEVKVKEENELKRRITHGYNIVSIETVRLFIGALGILIPWVTILTDFIFTGSFHLEFSMSDYYDNGVSGDFFVGTLFMLASFLFTYKGYEIIDSIAASFGAFCAMGVAVFPTTSDLQIVHNLHYVFFSLLFITFIYFSIYLFRKGDSREMITKQRKMRNRVYLSCGLIMIICMVGISINSFGVLGDTLNKYNFTLWFEVLAFFAFGLSWITKSNSFIFTDKYRYLVNT